MSEAEVTYETTPTRTTVTHETIPQERRPTPAAEGHETPVRSALPPMSRERIRELVDQAFWIVSREKRWFDEAAGIPLIPRLPSRDHIVALLHVLRMAVEGQSILDERSL